MQTPVQLLQLQRRALSILFSAALCLAATSASLAQLPATQPTAQMTAPLAASPVTEKPSAAHRADVTFANGLLTVRANDSSLHQILRSISRQTGMKVTGGIADMRVFGDYGPAAPATVLATLTDGTGVNMLLREGSSAPLELILTPRTAGASPPSFDASAQDAEAEQSAPQQNRNDVPPPLRSDRTPQRSPSERDAARAAAGLPPSDTGSVPPTMPQPLNNVLGSENNTTPTASQLPTTTSVPLDSLPTPSTAVGGPGIVDSTNPPPAGSTTGPAPATTTTDAASPNGVKTPEQIFQQLLLMQQQQKTTPPK